MLLDLPAEIRVQIYHAILVNPHQPIHPVYYNRHTHHINHPTRPILHVCRTIAVEAKNIYWRYNHFELRMTKVGAFLSGIRASRRELKSLTITFAYGHFTSPYIHHIQSMRPWRLLKKCVRLEHLGLKAVSEFSLNNINSSALAMSIQGLTEVKIVGLRPRRKDIDRDEDENEMWYNETFSGYWILNAAANNAAARAIRTAWLTPKPRCQHCWRTGKVA